MKLFKLFGIYALIISLSLSGCSGVAGESFQDIVEEAKLDILAEDVLIGHGDIKTCMFTVWYFTEPEVPPIEQVADMCKIITTSMDEYDFSRVIEEIEKELDMEAIEPVICTGNCV